MKPSKTAKNWDELTARDLMRTDLMTVPMHAPLSDVERVLGEQRIGGVPVTNEAGRIVGMISIRDLLERYATDPDARRDDAAPILDATDDTDEPFELAPDLFRSGLSAADVMNSEVYSVKPTTSLRNLAKKMVDWNVHRVLVEDRGKHIGLITTMDILMALAR